MSATAIKATSLPPYVGRGNVDRDIANFFAPRLAAATREGDAEARAALIAGREIAHASQRGALLVQIMDMPEPEIERYIGVHLPREADTSFRLAMLALGLRGEDL